MYERRNRLGVSIGGRISELLRLQIRDVYQNGKPVTDLLFDKNIVKGGEVSRAVLVNSDGRRAISDLIASYQEPYNCTHKKPSTLSIAKQTGHPVHVPQDCAQCPESRFYCQRILTRNDFADEDMAGTDG